MKLSPSGLPRRADPIPRALLLLRDVRPSACAKCGTRSVVETVRLRLVPFFRCEDCGHMWAARPDVAANRPPSPA